MTREDAAEQLKLMQYDLRGHQLSAVGVAITALETPQPGKMTTDELYTWLKLKEHDGLTTFGIIVKLVKKHGLLEDSPGVTRHKWTDGNVTTNKHYTESEFYEFMKEQDPGVAIMTGDLIWRRVDGSKIIE